MTFNQVWTFIRWPIAILGLALVVNYALPRLAEVSGDLVEFNGGPLLTGETESAAPEADPLDVPVTEIGEPTLQAPTGPVTDGAATPLADYFVNDTIVDVDGTLVLSDDPADAIVLAFDIPAGDPGCMAVMNLNLTASEVLSQTTVGVYPSTDDQPQAVVDNGSSTEDLRASDEPIATLNIGQPGTVTFDITAGYQAYFNQDFPPGRPLALTIAAIGEVGTQGGVSFVASESADEEVPRLLWTGTPGCPVDQEAPAPTDDPLATPLETPTGQ